jgi:hypothetical protein
MTIGFGSIPNGASFLVSGLLLVVSGLLFTGCEGKGSLPNVPAGQFTARVQGALSDTLRGPVHYRSKGDSLVGLELGAKDEPGLSIELEPQPPALRTYEVINWELLNRSPPGTPPGTVAFLTVDEAQFKATDGSLELTYVDEEQIGAQFTFLMEGEFTEGPSEMPSVEITGSLNAPPEP